MLHASDLLGDIQGDSAICSVALPIFQAELSSPGTKRFSGKRTSEYSPLLFVPLRNANRFVRF